MSGFNRLIFQRHRFENRELEKLFQRWVGLVVLAVGVGVGVDAVVDTGKIREVICLHTFTKIHPLICRQALSRLLSYF